MKFKSSKFQHLKILKVQNFKILQKFKILKISKKNQHFQNSWSALFFANTGLSDQLSYRCPFAACSLAFAALRDGGTLVLSCSPSLSNKLKILLRCVSILGAIVQVASYFLLARGGCRMELCCCVRVCCPHFDAHD